jgi:hypothetical protein
MRTVSEYTEEDANDFGRGRWVVAALTPVRARVKDLGGQMMTFANYRGVTGLVADDQSARRMASSSCDAYRHVSEYY